MSESAFGVEHGEVSKSALNQNAVNGLRKLGQQQQMGGAKIQGPKKPGFAGGAKPMGKKPGMPQPGGMQRPMMAGPSMKPGGGAGMGANSFLNRK